MGAAETGAAAQRAVGRAIAGLAVWGRRRGDLEPWLLLLFPHFLSMAVHRRHRPEPGTRVYCWIRPDLCFPPPRELHWVSLSLSNGITETNSSSLPYAARGPQKWERCQGQRSADLAPFQCTEAQGGWDRPREQLSGCSAGKGTKVGLVEGFWKVELVWSA